MFNAYKNLDIDEVFEMTTLVNALYPIFLGVFLQYLFHLKPAASKSGASRFVLEIHPTKSDILHLAGFSLYFFTDWINCLTLTTDISVTSKIYAFGSVLTVVFLGLSMLSSIGSFDGAFRFFGLYHLFATLADTAWLCAYIISIPEVSLSGTEILKIGGPIILYLIIRVVITIFAFTNMQPRGSQPFRRIIFTLGLFIHPFGIILLSVLRS